MAIAEENLRSLLNLIYIPRFQKIVSAITVHILSSIQHTPIIFHRTLKDIKILSLHKDQDGIEELLDTFSALVQHFSGFDDLYKSIVNIFYLLSTIYI